MRRGTSSQVAVGSAFARSAGGGAESTVSETRLHRAALAFVVGFPAFIGAGMLVGAFSRSGVSDSAFGVAIACFVVAAILLILGVRSRVQVGPGQVTVRFFGFRSTLVAFADLASATFAMSFPSISYVIVLTDRAGRNVRLHANWWRDERSVVAPVCRALLRFDVPMDRSTARVVSRVLRVKRPIARIVHHGLIWKDKTW